MDIQQENMLTMTEASAWCESNIGKRVNRSTIHRWRTRGARGVKLEMLLIGGRRFTSSEALHRFFFSTTSAADGCDAVALASVGISDSEAYLASEGI